MNKSKTDEMLRKQASNFRAFERTVSNIHIDSVTEKWEFEDLLRLLQSRWSAIDSLHWEIDSEIQGTNQEYERSFSSHEQTYNNIKRSLNSKLWSASHRDNISPRIDIPTFQGNYHTWVSFKDLFAEAIHTNPSLSNAQKMQLLKSKVRGEAEKLIQHLPISSDNYNTCWEILNHRYNNKKLIFTSYINNMMNLPAMQQPSLYDIKRLHDTTLETLNAVKNLQVDISTWDPLLVHILVQKLDNDTHNDYHESLKQPRELPTIQEFLNFLESKFTSMESSRRKQESSTSKQLSSRHQKSSFQAFANNKVTPTAEHNKNVQSAGFKCPLCGENHGLYYCERFLAMIPQLKRSTITKLNLCTNCLKNHSFKDCLSQKRCRECQGMHNSILHEAFASRQNVVQATSPRNANPNNPVQESSNYLSNSHVSQQGNCPEVLLATAIVQIQAADGTYHDFRALLDQGSQTSIITEKASQLLSLPRRRCRGIISGIGAQENNCKGVININIKSTKSDFTLNIDAFIMKSLINNLPSCSFTKPTWPFLENIQLADPEFHKRRPVDILLGADVYSNVLLDGICRADQSSPIAQNTKFGWIISGHINQPTLQCNVIINNIEDIQKFFEIEDITPVSSLSEEDQSCIDFYKSSTIRREDGRYQVCLPLKPNFEHNLGKSKQKAVAQFLQMERKFINQNKFSADYKLFMEEYLAAGHMKPAVGNAKPECYLPHHGVHRPESKTTSLRVVINASAKTSSGFSLNDLMYRGPNLQQDLQGLILKWRQYKYAYTADLEKMFRQIWLSENHQSLQKIIWRDDPSKPLQDYCLTTVSFGVKAAPYLSMMTLHQLACDEKDNYVTSKATQVLKESFYMDDLIHGCHSLQSAKILQRDLIQLLKSGGFNLRKWSSNAPELLHDNHSNQNFDFREMESTKTLGLQWNPLEDHFSFQLKIETSQSEPTKRSLLSDISKLFDPLGWLSPISTKLKSLFQATWTANIDWDETLPSDICKEWRNIKNDLQNITQFKIQRWLKTTENDVIELHGFSDSSTVYAGVIYCKVTREGQSTVVLVVGKTRIVPASKKVTLPRLELCGAVLLAKLMEKVMRCLQDYKIHQFGWTDSTAVLGWLQGDPNKWKTFVANRVKQVTNIIPGDCWRYIKSKENPADCASRGLTATQLRDHSLWWQGPSWLQSYNKDQSPPQPAFETSEEIKPAKQVNISIYQEMENNLLNELINKYSSFNKLVRVLAWVRRFISTCTRKTSLNHTYLTLEEIRSARLSIIKYIQEQEFSRDIQDLKKENHFSSKSKLFNLHPFVDPDGILRVGGRLRNAEISSEMKHPIIIPHGGRLTELLIDDAHILTFHGGARLTTSFLRQKYWIIGGYNATKKRLRLCVKCRRHDSRKQHQLMADLPYARVGSSNSSRPFERTGLDFTGNFMIKSSKGRGIKCTKGYVAVFVCMATKAVHFELVSDLTTSSFLAALKRMAARRGTPQHIYSDNGTNFVGASNVMQQEYELLLSSSISMDNQEFMHNIIDMKIQWHFNAPSWPSAGGLWEAAVKSLKYHLKRVVGEQKLTYEEFTTVLSQLEACLNTRPLCPITEDPDNLDVLTPAHFLSSGPVNTILHNEHDLRTRWYFTQKIVSDIWKRWRLEYLTQLSARSKWERAQENIKINDIVTIHDDNLPAGRWAIGRVVEVHPGRDGLVRVVTLKTKNGFLKRPIVKLSILPTNPSSENLKEPQTKQETRQKKKFHVNFCSIAMGLLYFLSILTTSECSFHVTLKENQEIYFNKISSMQLARNAWKIDMCYNMEPYWKGMNMLDKYQKYLQQTYSAIKEQSQRDVIIWQLRHSYTELENYNSISLTQDFRTRSRRGIINGVRYLPNTPFGVLDAKFAEQCQEDTTLIRDNQQNLASLWLNQTSAVEAEYNLLNRSEETIKNNIKL